MEKQNTKNNTAKTILGGLGILIAVFIGIIALLAVVLIGQYNSFVRLEQEVENQQAQVETVLQRRYDLIPNLVNSVKGAMDQEEDIFTAISEARTKYGNATSGSEEKISAANELESNISRLLLVIENYPDLRSNETVKGLMDELAGTENRISVERQRYNDVVTNYNTKIKVFPGSLLAQMFGFEEKPLFEAVTEAQEAPVVELED